MRFPRLNLWQRAGIVASVLWFIGGYLHEMSAQEPAIAQLAFGPCTTGPNPTSSIDCGRDTYRILWEGARDTALIYATFPVIVVWILAYLTLWVGRWIWAGRRKP